MIPARSDVPKHLQSESPSIFSTNELRYWDVKVDDVIRIAMTNSKVLRDLGGRIVSQPNQTVTSDIPELVRSNATTGVAAALAAFDAQWKGTLSYSKTENGLRNPIVGSAITTIKQERGLGSIGITKVGQAGTRFSLAHGHIYDADNVGVPPSRFGSAFDTYMFLEGRHPLARGGGRVYNAVAGPNSPFGTYNGYWIASIRSDIADDELRISTRDYVYNVIRGYWLLRFAYDNVTTRQTVRDLAFDELQIVEGKYAEGVVDETLLLQAKDKYLAAQQLYEDAVAGPPERKLAGLLGPNGALISGTELGLRTLERRLRLLIGLPAGEGGLLRPIDEPIQAPIQFDFKEALRTAMVSRPELRRQAKVIESHRMEWLAARNLRLPSVDLVGSYRVHGFGNSVFGDASVPQDSSASEFLKGNLQDISAGLEITRPIGNRLAATAERNAMVAISRENAILEAQQLEVSHEVTSALAEIERSLRAVHTCEERIRVARHAFENLSAKFEEGVPISKESVLESNRAVVELELGAAIARIDYSIALASLSVARGTLLNEVAVFCGAEYGGSEIPMSTYPPDSPISRGPNPLTQNEMVNLNQGTPVSKFGKPSADDPQMARVVLAPPQVDASDQAVDRLASPASRDAMQYR
jgi:outer membrane protein TolC